MATMNGIDFAHLMNSGQFSDLTLVCQDQKFKIHKLVACAQSSVIAAALKGEFKEAESGVINIEQFEVETVRRMVEYLYTGDYDQNKEQSNAATTASVATPTTAASIATTTTSASTSFSTTPGAAASAKPSVTPSVTLSIAPSITSSSTPAPLVTYGTLQHVQVNAIADYYEIQGLVQLANQKIQRAYYTSWDPKTFVDTAKTAISISGDHSLHTIMALLTAQRLKELLKSGQLPNLVGDFAASVLIFHAHLLEASQREQVQVTLQQRQQAQAEAQQQLAQAQQQQALAQQQLAQAQLQLAQAQLEAQQQQNELEAKWQAAEARADRMIENVDKLVELTNAQEFCRNGACNQAFTSYLDEAGDLDDFLEPSYVLRCSSCGCRHYTN